MKNKKNIKLAIIIFSVIGVAVIFVVLLYKYFAPFGKVVSYTFTSKIPGAQEATTFPTSKNNLLSIPSQIVTTPQARFTVNLLSQKINSIYAKLRFKKGPREVRLGVRSSEKDNFTYHPLYQSQLQDLAWPQTTDSGFTLWQKEKIYSSVGDFVKNVRPDKKIVEYYIDVDKLSFLKPSQVIGDAHAVISSQLRGNHIFLVRVDKAPFILKIAKQDLNAYEGEDRVKIVVSKDGKNIAEQTIVDDGVTTASNLKMQQQEAVVTVKDIKPGLYQVDFISEGKGSDSIVTKLDFNQAKVVLKNYFYALGGKPALFWTNAKKLTISTWHPEGLQTVKLNGDKELKITEVNKNYSFDLEQLSANKGDTSLYQLDFSKNDLVVNYDGYIVFNKDTYFEPDTLRSVPLMTLDTLDGVDYVLSTYPKAKQDGDWLVSETIFDPKDIKITGDKLYFSLEMPDLAKYGGELEIDSLEIDVKSDGVLSNAGKEKKDVVKPAVSEKEVKKNIFVQCIDWVKGLLSKLPFFRSSKPAPTPTPSVKITPIPTIVPSPTATKVELLIRVLNGGGEKGAAASVSALLKTNGFTNVQTDNATRFDYTGVTLRSRGEDTKVADTIASLLKKEYGTINRVTVATSTAEATIIIGKKQ